MWKGEGVGFIHRAELGFALSEGMGAGNGVAYYYSHGQIGHGFSIQLGTGSVALGAY